MSWMPSDFEWEIMWDARCGDLEIMKLGDMDIYIYIDCIYIYIYYNIKNTI